MRLLVEFIGLARGCCAYSVRACLVSSIGRTPWKTRLTRRESVLHSSVQSSEIPLHHPRCEAESFRSVLLQMHKFSATRANLPWPCFPRGR